MQMVDGAVGTQRIETDPKVSIVHLQHGGRGHQTAPAGRPAVAGMFRQGGAMLSSCRRRSQRQGCDQGGWRTCFKKFRATRRDPGSTTWGQQSSARGTSSTCPYSMGDTLMNTCNRQRARACQRGVKRQPGHARVQADGGRPGCRLLRDQEVWDLDGIRAAGRSSSCGVSPEAPAGAGPADRASPRDMLYDSRGVAGARGWGSP